MNTPTALTRKEVGKLGEDIAVKYLKKKGCKILQRNYLPKFIKSFGRGKGEIDIIIKEKDTICFIEVKSVIKGTQKFLPEDKVNFFKQRKLIRLAKMYFLENKISQNRKWQIDVISVMIDLDSRKARLRHFENAVADIY